MRGKILLLVIISLVLSLSLASLQACRKDVADSMEETAETDIETVQETDEEAKEETTDPQENETVDGLEDEKEDEGNTSDTQAKDTEADDQASDGQSQQEDTQETGEQGNQGAQEIPDDIEAIIDDADYYYNLGEYALAQKEYRKAQLELNDSDLSDETKEEFLSYVDNRYEECKNIVDTARMHYANSMRLQYEKRFDEALAELEAALEIYPKYQEAIDAYETLKAMMGLS